MHPILQIAIRAVRKGGNLILQNYDKQKVEKEKKSSITNFSEKIINLSENAIRYTIKKSYPFHIILNKKTQPTILNKKKIYWIINPLNGKENFFNGIPHFCIGASAIIKNNLELSVIYDPIKNDLFTSVKGQGSQINGYRMRCSNIRENFIASTYINKKAKELTVSNYSKTIKILLKKHITIRSSGSLLLDLAYIAAGKLTCFFYFNKKNYNFYIGELQVKEAGGLIKPWSAIKTLEKFKTAFIIGHSALIKEIEYETLL